MNLKQRDVACLEKSSAVYVLLAISDNEGATKKAIIESGEGENVRTKFQRINEFIDLGLVRYVKEDDDPHNSGSLYLTDEGKEIANNLKKIRSVLLKLEKNKASAESE